jgi:hypothetical protein
MQRFCNPCMPPSEVAMVSAVIYCREVLPRWHPVEARRLSEVFTNHGRLRVQVIDTMTILAAEWFLL